MIASSDPPEESMEDPEWNLVRKRNYLKWEDFFLEGADEDEAKNMMASRRPGVFLMVAKDSSYTLMVKRHHEKTIRAYYVKKDEVHGQRLYYLEKGTSAKTIVGVIQKQRRALRLYVPFHVPDDEEEDDEDEDEDEEEDDTNSTSETDKTDPIDKEMAHLPYFWEISHRKKLTKFSRTKILEASLSGRTERSLSSPGKLSRAKSNTVTST